MTTLPDWIQAVSTTLALFIAIGVALWQANIHAQQVKQTLFDRRYKLFQQIDTFLVNTWGGVPPEHETYLRAFNASIHAQYLFGPEVVEFNEQVRCLVQRWNDLRKIRDCMANPEESNRARREMAGIVEQLGVPCHMEMTRVYEPYLLLHRERAWTRLNRWVEGVEMKMERRQSLTE
jgi:hypothetical protein